MSLKRESAIQAAFEKCVAEIRLVEQQVLLCVFTVGAIAGSLKKGYGTSAVKTLAEQLNRSSTYVYVAMRFAALAGSARTVKKLAAKGFTVQQAIRVSAKYNESNGRRMLRNVVSGRVSPRAVFEASKRSPVSCKPDNGRRIHGFVSPTSDDYLDQIQAQTGLTNRMEVVGAIIDGVRQADPDGKAFMGVKSRTALKSAVYTRFREMPDMSLAA